MRILSKNERFDYENKYLCFFLIKIPHLIESIKILGADMNKLMKIASTLKYQFVKNNTVLYRVGDYSDEMLLIIKGSVTIFKIKDRKVKMSEDEFIHFLSKLKLHKEEYLFDKIVESNKLTFDINLTDRSLDNHESWRRSKFKSSAKLNTMIENNKIVYKNNEPNEVTSEEFMEKFAIYLRPVAISERKIVNIWEYEFLKKITTGDRLGEKDLEMNSYERY